jgi:hypothetical protein
LKILWIPGPSPKTRLGRRAGASALKKVKKTLAGEIMTMGDKKFTLNKFAVSPESRICQKK